MNSVAVKIITHVGAALGGAAIGGTIVFLATRKKYYNDVEEVRRFYRNKKSAGKAEPFPTSITPNDISEKEKPQISKGSEDIIEVRESPQHSEFTDYRAFFNKDDIVGTTDEVPFSEDPEEPYAIPVSEFGMLEGWAEETMTYFSNGIVTDSNFDKIEQPEDILGSDFINLLERDNFQSPIYIRNSTTMTDYCVTPTENQFIE